MADAYYNITDAEAQANAEEFLKNLNEHRTPTITASIEELASREAMTDAEIQENVNNWLVAMENDHKRKKGTLI